MREKRREKLSEFIEYISTCVCGLKKKLKNEVLFKRKRRRKNVSEFRASLRFFFSPSREIQLLSILRINITDPFKLIDTISIGYQHHEK